MAHDYKAMYDAEIAERHAFGYPPFVRLLKLTIRHKDQQTAEQAGHILASWLQPLLGSQLMGPAVPLVARVRNNYLQELLIKLPRDAKSIAQIKQRIQDYIIQLRTEKKFRTVAIIPDVDGV
jgi:primosomal protein N' (replication factor Y)